MMGRRNIVKFLKRYKQKISNKCGEVSKKDLKFEFLMENTFIFQAAVGDDFVLRHVPKTIL